MAEVTLYGTFRRHVAERQVNIDAATLGALLHILTADNPALHDALFDPAHGAGAPRPSDAEGDCPALRPYVRVLVDGHDVALGDCLDTVLEADAVVSIFSPIAGG